MKSLGNFARGVGGVVLDTALDAIGPLACGLCGSPDVVGGDGFLCESCSRAVIQCCVDASCPRCGHSVPPFGSEPKGCGRCLRHRPPYDRVVRVGIYDGALRSLFLRFKFGGLEELDAYFVGRLARQIARSDVFETIDAFVAVPTCWQHRLRRSFHPAEVLAARLSRRLGIPLAPLLVRRGGGPHQTGQPVAVRLSNVRGKFRLARGCGVNGATLCLVDDVMTSGATVAECSRILKRAGAKEVIVAVVARAGDDPISLVRS